MIEILTGIVAGSVSGLGMGGGTILILVLSNFLGIEQHIAQATNLVFFVPTAISAIIINIKQKLVDVRLGLIIILSGAIGAIIGSEIAVNLEASNLKKYFGIFLLLISVNEIYWLIREYILSKKTHNKGENIKFGGR